jgi:ribonuclease P protein component
VAQDDPTTKKPGRLKTRPDFLAVQKGTRLRGPFFCLKPWIVASPTKPPGSVTP